MDIQSGGNGRSAPKPQLTPMLDIFSVLILFLIAGTVFGTAAIQLPNGLNLAQSVRREVMETAPQVTVTTSGVEVPFLRRRYTFDTFRQSDGAQKPELSALKESVQRYIATLNPEARSAGVLLNVVADKSATYRDVYDVVRVFREAGFDSVLFVSAASGAAR